MSQYLGTNKDKLDLTEIEKNYLMSLVKKLCRNLSLLACCFADDFSVFIMAYSTVN